jgi:cyclopropane-fatty-acyl-phospholipid synthase
MVACVPFSSISRQRNARAIERAGLLVTDIEILRLHYAETLKAWRERFLAHREEVERIYDQRFVRMWEFYLAASEMSFREQDMMVFQIQLTKRQDVVPMTRDYILREEQRLFAAEGKHRPPLRLAGEELLTLCRSLVLR